MPSSQDIWGQYQTASGQRNADTTSYAKDTSDAAALPEMIKQSLNQKYGNFQPQIDAEAKAKADYFGAPSEARDTYQGVANPFTRDRLVQSAVNNKMRNYDTSSGISKTIFDNLDKVIGQGVQGYGMQLQGRKALLDNENQNVNELGTLYGSTLSNETQRSIANANLAMQRQQLDASREQAKYLQDQEAKRTKQQQLVNEAALADNWDVHPENRSAANLAAVGAIDNGDGTYTLPLTGKRLSAAQAQPAVTPGLDFNGVDKNAFNF